MSTPVNVTDNFNDTLVHTIKDTQKVLASSILKDLPKCQYSFSTSIGELLVVDDRLSREQQISYCKERSGVLAPLKTLEIIKEIRGKLRTGSSTSPESKSFSCIETNGKLQKRDEVFYKVGLKAVNGTATWSDGTEYSACFHDSVEDFWPLPSAPRTDWEKYSLFGKEFSDCQSYYLTNLISTDGRYGLVPLQCDQKDYRWEKPANFPFMCLVRSSSPASLVCSLNVFGGSRLCSVIVTVIAVLIPSVFIGYVICYVKRKRSKNRNNADQKQRKSSKSRNNKDNKQRKGSKVRNDEDENQIKDAERRKSKDDKQRRDSKKRESKDRKQRKDSKSRKNSSQKGSGRTLDEILLGEEITLSFDD